jgi:hypothetical protein
VHLQRSSTTRSTKTRPANKAPRSSSRAHRRRRPARGIPAPRRCVEAATQRTTRKRERRGGCARTTSSDTASYCAARPLVHRRRCDSDSSRVFVTKAVCDVCTSPFPFLQSVCVSFLSRPPHVHVCRCRGLPSARERQKGVNIDAGALRNEEPPALASALARRPPSTPGSNPLFTIAQNFYSVFATQPTHTRIEIFEMEFFTALER